MQRKATASWKGTLKGGTGTLDTQSGALSAVSYSFPTRFEAQPGTNPEELIAAAHAGCFSMALAAQLGERGWEPEVVDTSASVTLEKAGAGWSVTRSHLEVRARVPGADPAGFEAAANAAKEGCPISRLLNAKITMEARLE